MPTLLNSLRFTLPSLAAAASLLLGSCGLRLPTHTLNLPEQLTKPFASPTPATRSPQNTTTSPHSSHVDVWVIADHFHTGVVFPYPWLVESGFIPPANFGNPKYVTLSWGNRDAYSKEGIDNPYKLFRVLFTPTPSVMELISFDWNVVDVCPHQRIWKNSVARHHGKTLAYYLNECTKHDASGRPIVVCESSWGKGVQLEGKYPYFIPRVCNVWTAQSLESLGYSMSPWFGLTANGLARQIEKAPNDFIKIWNGTPIKSTTKH